MQHKANANSSLSAPSELSQAMLDASQRKRQPVLYVCFVWFTAKMPSQTPDVSYSLPVVVFLEEKQRAVINQERIILN